MSPGDRMGKGLDFMLKGIGPKDKTARVRSHDSRVRSRRVRTRASSFKILVS